MDEIRQCWAFNSEGLRCDHPAGHVGEHINSTYWDDSECFAPADPGTPATAKTGISVIPPVVAEEPAPAANCVACAHKHKGGTCRCGCYEYIG